MRFPINEKIIIEKGGGALSQNDSSKRRKKGLLDSVFESDYPARRLAESESGFSFYDGGLRKYGDSFIEQSFVFDPPITAAPPALGVQLADLRQADLKAKADAMLAFGVENFAGLFKQITRENSDFYKITFRSNTFNITLKSDSDSWSEDGLTIKVPEEQLADSDHIYINPNPFANFISVTGQYAYKTTAQPNFDADHVELVLQGDEKIFLMPAMCQFDIGQSGLIPEPFVTGWLAGETDFIGRVYGSYFTYPRLQLSDQAMATLQSKNYQMVVDSRYPNAVSNYSDLYNAWYEFGQFVAGRYYSRFLMGFTGERMITTDNGVIFHKETWLEEFDRSSFPYRDELFPPPPALPDPYYGTHHGSLQFIILGGSATYTGDLLAVIQQGSSFYYVWQEGYG